MYHRCWLNGRGVQLKRQPGRSLEFSSQFSNFNIGDKIDSEEVGIATKSKEVGLEESGRLIMKNVYSRRIKKAHEENVNKI